MNAERFHKLREVLSRRQPDLTILMERVHKAHNLSAILRNCDGVGVDVAHAIPVEQTRLRMHGQIAMGASRWVPVTLHRSTTEAFTALRERGFRMVAAHPDEGARDLRAIDFTRPTCLVVGAELEGLGAEALDLADDLVQVPLRGMVGSLNVSVATAVVLYEAERQRASAGFYDAPRIPEPEFTRRLFEWSYPRIARRCRDLGLPYPALTDDGELVDADDFMVR